MEQRTRDRTPAHPRIATRTMLLTAPLVLAALYATPAQAVTFNYDGLFAASDRSIWASGAGFSLDTGPRFLGTSWDLGKTVGGITEACVPFLGCARAGVEIGARTSGSAGIGYGLKVESGTFDLQYPGRASFNVPNAGSGSTIGAISVGSSFAALAGGVSIPGQSQVRRATMQVQGPTAQAYLDLAAELHAFAGAAVCVGVCYGPSIGPIDFNGSREIASINRDGSGEIRVLGDKVSANQSITALDGLLNASFRIPDLDSSSAATPGGFNGSQLTSTRRDNVAAVNANIAQIAANAVGLPIPLSGKLGPIGYNLLQANAGATIDVQQTLQFTPSASGRYVFSANVVPRINGVDRAPTNVIDFNFGDDVTFSPGQVASVSFQPFITLGGTVRNQTDLVLGGDVAVKAMGANVAGLSIGPIIDQHVANGDLGRISIFDRSFQQTIGTIKAQPITLDFAGCQQRFGGSSEFPLFGICASSGLDPLVTNINPDGTREDELYAFQCSAHLATEFGTCLQYPASSTSPYFPKFGPDLFISGPDALTFDPINPGPSTTNRSDLALLASLGYDGRPLGEGPAFVIPDGDPLDSFPVPEPGSLAVLGLGLIGLRAARPRRARQQAHIQH